MNKARCLIRSSTKKGQALLSKARANLGYRLSGVYSSWSNDKQEAYNTCRWLCGESKGRNFRIISANRYGFSVAWEYDNPLTGGPSTVIHTPNNVYVIDGTADE